MQDLREYKTSCVFLIQIQIHMRLCIPSSPSFPKSIGSQEGGWRSSDTRGGTSPVLTMQDTRINNGTSTLAGFWSGDMVAARRTFTWSICVGFNGTTGGFGWSTIKGAVLPGTRCDEMVGSVPCATLSGPSNDPCGNGCADTVCSGSSGTANPSITPNSHSTSLSSAWSNQTFLMGDNNQTNGGNLRCNIMSRVPDSCQPRKQIRPSSNTWPCEHLRLDCRVQQWQSPSQCHRFCRNEFDTGALRFWWKSIVECEDFGYKGGRNLQKVKEQQKEKLTKLLTRLWWLVTTVAALWGVQDIAKKRKTGIPNLLSISLQPIPHPKSQPGPWGHFSEPGHLCTLEFSFSPSF